MEIWSALLIIFGAIFVFAWIWSLCLIQQSIQTLKRIKKDFAALKKRIDE